MLEYLKGKVAGISDESFILEMGDTGVEVRSSRKTIEKLVLNEQKLIFTRIYVKEDDIQLYGFDSREERQMFHLITTVSGIGPKAALSVLSSFEPGELAVSIIREDIDSLTRVRGIGKKNAGRLVLELKDKIKKNRLSVDPAVKDVTGDRLDGEEVGEAMSALAVLGYPMSDIKRVLRDVYTPGMSVEEILREALRNI